MVQSLRFRHLGQSGLDLSLYSINQLVPEVFGEPQILGQSCQWFCPRLRALPNVYRDLSESGYRFSVRMLYPDSLKNRDKFLAFSDRADSVARMIQSGFLSEEDRKALTALARDGSSPCRVSRRANALVLLDKGWSCQQVADALLLDDDTIRGWRKLFEQRGIEGITSFDVGGSASYLSVKQEDDLKAWVGAALPRSTRQIGAWIEKEFGLVYESRSGLIALLHRLGLEYHKPNVIPRKLNEEKQKAFIASYEKLLNSLG